MFAKICSERYFNKKVTTYNKLIILASTIYDLLFGFLRLK